MIRRLNIAILVSACIVAGYASLSTSGSGAAFSARAGLDAATNAAKSWAPDARLVYVENDEDIGADGHAVRWGYLFYSRDKGETRAYSIRDYKVIEATELDFDFEAPPLPDEWIDSNAAMVVAERNAGEKYRREHNGRLATMLLIRGAFNVRNPDGATWTLLYTSDTEPGLFVVVDAAKGNVIRTWKG